MYPFLWPAHASNNARTTTSSYAVVHSVLFYDFNSDASFLPGNLALISHVISTEQRQFNISLGFSQQNNEEAPSLWYLYHSLRNWSIWTILHHVQNCYLYDIRKKSQLIKRNYSLQLSKAFLHDVGLNCFPEMLSYYATYFFSHVPKRTACRRQYSYYFSEHCLTPWVI